MCINNKTRSKPSILIPLLLLLLASLGVCQGDVLKSGGGAIELPTFGPLLNVDNADGSDGNSDFEQLIESKLNESARSQTMQTQELLSRKRRYLIFPEGSSFQMGESVSSLMPLNVAIYMLHLFRPQFSTKSSALWTTPTI